MGELPSQPQARLHPSVAVVVDAADEAGAWAVALAVVADEVEEEVDEPNAYYTRITYTHAHLGDKLLEQGIAVVLLVVVAEPHFGFELLTALHIAELAHMSSSFLGLATVPSHQLMSTP